MPPQTLNSQNRPNRVLSAENSQELDNLEELQAEQYPEDFTYDLDDAAKLDRSREVASGLYRMSEEINLKVAEKTSSEILEAKPVFGGSVNFVERTEINFESEQPKVEAENQNSQESEVIFNSDSTQAEQTTGTKDQSQEKLVDFPLLGKVLKEKASGIGSLGESAFKAGKEVGGSLVDLFNYVLGRVDIYYRAVSGEKGETDPKKLEKKAKEKKKTSIKQSFYNNLQAATNAVRGLFKRSKQIAEGIGAQIGGNENYTGHVDQTTGEVTTYAESLLSKAASERTERETKLMREHMRKQADPTGGIRLDTVAEGGRLSTTGGAGAG